MNKADLTTESTVIGKLSLSSFVKLCVIAALGVLPVMGLVLIVCLMIGLIRSAWAVIPMTDFQPTSSFILVFLSEVVGVILPTILTGVFFGFAGYPFYSWLCRRRCGIELKGYFLGKI